MSYLLPTELVLGNNARNYELDLSTSVMRLTSHISQHARGWNTIPVQSYDTCPIIRTAATEPQSHLRLGQFDSSDSSIQRDVINQQTGNQYGLQYAPEVRQKPGPTSRGSANIEH
jgi:hypothetical protein